MCLIIKSDCGFSHLDQDMRDSIYWTNSDGFGFMYYSEIEGGLVAEKGLYDPDIIDIILDELPDDRTVFVHWRMGTSGTVSKDMAHPYMVDNRLAMMHNGVLTKYNPSMALAHWQYNKKTGRDEPVYKRRTDTNDTLNFITSRVYPHVSFDPDAWMKPGFMNSVEQEIGGSNKLVFMDDDGHWAVYNYGDWVEHEGMLFSNTYAWPYDERVLGIDYSNYFKGKKKYYTVGEFDSYDNDSNGAADYNVPDYKEKGELTYSDLLDMDYDDIFSAAVNAPELIADFLYYQALGETYDNTLP